MCSTLFRYYIKQIGSMLPCVCSVIDHRRRQNVVRTSVAYSAITLCATFSFLPNFYVICELLLNRRTATWNPFVNWNIDYPRCLGNEVVVLSKPLELVLLGHQAIYLLVGFNLHMFTSYPRFCPLGN